MKGSDVDTVKVAAKSGEQIAVEQWVELYEAHTRGDDLGPIFNRHVEEASERVRAALSESDTEGDSR